MKTVNVNDFFDEDTLKMERGREIVNDEDKISKLVADKSKDCLAELKQRYIETGKIDLEYSCTLNISKGEIKYDSSPFNVAKRSGGFVTFSKHKQCQGEDFGRSCSIYYHGNIDLSKSKSNKF